MNGKVIRWDWDARKCVRRIQLQGSVIDPAMNHRNRGEPDIATIIKKLEDTVLFKDEDFAGIEVTLMPITAFVSGLQKEWFRDVDFSKEVVLRDHVSFLGQPAVMNHDWWIESVSGFIHKTQGKDIDEERASMQFLIALTRPEIRDSAKRGEIQEVSVAFFTEEDFDIEVDEDTGQKEAVNFRVTRMFGEHIGLVQRAFISPNNGAGVAIGVEIGDFMEKSQHGSRRTRSAMRHRIADIGDLDDNEAVQSVLLDKDAFPDRDTAVDWATENDYSADDIQETDLTWIVKQRDSGDFVEGSTRTEELEGVEGVSLVIGQLNPDLLADKLEGVRLRHEIKYQTLVWKKEGFDIAALELAKSAFATRSEAADWARDHGFEYTNLREEDESWTVYQRNQDQFDGLRSESLTDGVTAVGGSLTEPPKPLSTRQEESTMGDKTLDDTDPPGSDVDDAGKADIASVRAEMDKELADFRAERAEFAKERAEAQEAKRMEALSELVKRSGKTEDTFKDWTHGEIQKALIIAPEVRAQQGRGRGSAVSRMQEVDDDSFVDESDGSYRGTPQLELTGRIHRKSGIPHFYDADAEVNDLTYGLEVPRDQSVEVSWEMSEEAVGIMLDRNAHVLDGNLRSLVRNDERMQARIKAHVGASGTPA